MEEKNRYWYRKQIKGLILVMEDVDKKDIMVARSYLIEKLNMILNKTGINFHPLIEEALKDFFKEELSEAGNVKEN